MVELDTMLNLLQTVSFVVGVFYYIMTLQNSNQNQKHQLETRQAQLYMQEFRDLNKPENWQEYINATRSMEWTDYEDFHNKYGR